jgi:hypothetical protein
MNQNTIDQKIRKFVYRQMDKNDSLQRKILLETEFKIQENLKTLSFALPKNCKYINQNGSFITFAIEEEATFRTLFTGKEFHNYKSGKVEAKNLVSYRVPFPRSLFLITLRKDRENYTYYKSSMFALDAPFDVNDSKLYDSKIPHCLNRGSICLGSARLDLKKFSNIQKAIDAFFETFFGGVFVYNVNFKINDQRIRSYQKWSELSLEDMRQVTRKSYGKTQPILQHEYRFQDYNLTNEVKKIISSNLNKHFIEITEISKYKKVFEEIMKEIKNSEEKTQKANQNAKPRRKSVN